FGLLQAQRDRVQKQVEELERSLAVTQDELDLLSSETVQLEFLVQFTHSAPSGHPDWTDLNQRNQVHLNRRLCPQSEPDLSPSASSCLQLNLVYQQVVQETLDQLEALLAHNRRQQRELTAQMNGPIREPTREGPASSNQHPAKLFLGSFLKPYFKDRLTGLGPPANQEVKLKAQRMMGCPEDKKLKLKRWESWQKTLLVHSVTRDHLKRLMLPKLSRLDFLTSKLSSAHGADRQQLTEQIDDLEKDLQLLRMKREEELTGDRYEEHDWQKISNIDFEGTKDAEDIRLFWQNVLHPSINKTAWSSEEVQRLSAICRRHEERHWDSIAQELGTGRTAFMCLQMFQRFVSDSLKRSSWTAEEDEQLRELVQKMRIGNFIPYTQISYFMEGRDPTQLVYRWNQVLDPSLKRGSWTKQEDRLLLQAVARHGEKCWWKVRLEVPGRTDGACRDRYLDCLKKNIKKRPFERHEVELLEQLVKKHGVARWAKIAAEIPHRIDAQCLREWRKLVREPAQDRRKMKEEEEVQITEEEDDDNEDEVVEYMDSDEDCNKKRKRSMEEEQQEEYILPPMEEWVPAEVNQSSTSLSFTLVELPSSGEAPDRTAVRSTVLGRPGPSVIIGPPPRELSWEERHSSSAVLMASREALRLHLSALKQKVSTGPQPGRRPRPQAQELRCELQAAVTPWIGNLLIPKSQKRSAADVLREGGERRGVSTSSAFTLLLQAMNVDTLGCRQIIEQRKNQVDPLLLTVKTFSRVSFPIFHFSRQTSFSSSSSPLTSPPPSCPDQAPPTSVCQSGTLLNAAAMCHRTAQVTGMVGYDSCTLILQLQSESLPTSIWPVLVIKSVIKHNVLLPLQPTYRQESAESAECDVASPQGRTGLRVAQATKKKRSSAPSKQKHVGRAQSKGSSAVEAPPPSQVTALHFLPNRSMWVVTPVAQAPPPALQVGLLPRGPPLASEAPPPLAAGCSSVTPAALRDLQLSPVPTCRFKPLLPAVTQSSDLRPTSWPRPHMLLAYQRAGQHFDPTLMFLEPLEEVHDWLRGRGGVAVPRAGSALPYLPPSVSTLSALSGLLRAKASVTASALQLMAANLEQEPSGTGTEQQEELQAVRQLVAQRFSTNPAHQLLKARFLSLFTLPALLATVQPISRKKPTCPTTLANQESSAKPDPVLQNQSM
uniref:Small nuclear RNA activating complex, polypeptide 4 n=1 Tax=Poecilia formosa TaxID=48698 RepID=A0A087XX84_POEFO